MESLETALDGNVVGFSLTELLIRFLINLVAIFLLVRVIYYPRHKNKDFLFTFFLFNCLNFLICFLLSATKIKVGFAFGLFAIFSIMRYRTVMVPVKEMGYFFVCVAIGIINALATVDDNFIVLLCCNAFILGITIILDRNTTLTHENVKEIKYERIDLIHPEKRAEMIADLTYRTGFPIHRVDIITIDFLRDVAMVHAYYFSKENETKMAGVIDDD
jgi:hypothetical protein